MVVKFAGSNVDPENQLNGIAFQGVGDGTEVDYIEVYNNLDDGIEFFGGTVNANHVVLIGNADDSLDWTDGWTGSIQYLYIEQTQGAGDQLIEADNREQAEQATPISEPTIANATMVGNSTDRALRLRRGTGVHLYNTLVSGSEQCVRVDGESVDLLNTRITFQGIGLDSSTVNDTRDDPDTAQDEVQLVQDFLDRSTNVTQDGTTPNPVALPAGLDPPATPSSVPTSQIGVWAGPSA